MSFASTVCSDCVELNDQLGHARVLRMKPQASLPAWRLCQSTYAGLPNNSTRRRAARTATPGAVRTRPAVVTAIRMSMGSSVRIRH